MLFFSSQNERGTQTRPGLESTQRLGHPKLNVREMVVLIDVTVLCCWLRRLNLGRRTGVRLANFGVYRNGVMLLHRWWLLLLPVALNARDRLGYVFECTRFRIVGQRENDSQKEQFLDHYSMWIF